ncbi:hypothetical protein Ddye_008688 [Dipteronia dyeriana]|uniref:RNase H type-1 domain-containing protein n=1 Tax=Dipteronia dyeriana TaxID=168575 RepID=A0AAD9X9Y1_9ROSI|nr:hypothetical protein Ddye_008688 [Dipteronia dyeriana]
MDEMGIWCDQDEEVAYIINDYFSEIFSSSSLSSAQMEDILGLRKVLGCVISESQSAFVSGRLNTDNAMVGFECMHALRKTVNGNKGFMALKLDMAKAYDTVGWCFSGGLLAIVDSLKHASCECNGDVLSNNFFPEEADAIIGIPPCSTHLDDSLFLHFDKAWCFTVRSGYWSSKLDNGQPLSVVPTASCWQIPYMGVFKTNTDVGLRESDKVSGVGVVVRDSNGKVRLAYCHHLSAYFSPQVAEAMAILKGICLAEECGLAPVVLESDALFMVNMICRKEVSCTEVGVVIHDILGLIQRGIVLSVSCVPRLVKKVVHCLAELSLDHVGEFVWVEDRPFVLESLVLGDYPSSL